MEAITHLTFSLPRYVWVCIKLTLLTMTEVEQWHESIYPSLLSDLACDVISSLLLVWLFFHNGLLPTTVSQTNHFSHMFLLSRCFLTATRKKTKMPEVWPWGRHWDFQLFHLFPDTMRDSSTTYFFYLIMVPKKGVRQKEVSRSWAKTKFFLLSVDCLRYFLTVTGKWLWVIDHSLICRVKQELELNTKHFSIFCYEQNLICKFCFFIGNQYPSGFHQSHTSMV